MSDQPILHGMRVIEIAGGVAGPAAGLQLSEAGADVIRVEPPGGAPDSDSVLFSVLNRGKRRLALDLDSAAGRASLAQLLDGADVLLHDLGPAQARARGLDDGTLAGAYPRLVVSAIGGWPGRHPLADAPARETLVLARLGLLDEQPGHRDGPIFVRMPFAGWLAAWFCAIGIMARLIARRRDGRGGVAHTSLAQAALAPMSMHWSRAEHPTPAFARGLSKSTPIPLHRCLDDAWVHVHYSPDKAPWMAAALEAMGPVAVAAENAKYPPSHVAPNFGANKAIMATRPAREWVQHFWAHDVAAQVAAPFGAVYASTQARVNGYVVALDDPRRGRVLQPGPAYLSEPPPRVRGPLQGLEQAAPAAPAAPRPRPQPGPAAPADNPALPPLAGIKVLDLGAYLAGPFATMLLADLGAEVIKVEPPDGDAMRRLERVFAGTQRGKLGITLKLGEPGAGPALGALVRWADVVHHNIRLPAARKLGVDHAALKAIKPSLVFCHISAYGPVGEQKDWPGFDQLMQAACGWETACGGAGNPPMWLRFGVGDYFAALSSVFAVLLALYRKSEDGQGQAVAASLLGATLSTVAEAVMLADGSVTPIAGLDAAQSGLSPDHRLYRCLDGWLAVAALDASEARAFAGLAGAPGQREAWFAQRQREQALALLSAACVPAEPALERQGDAFHDDPGHAAAKLHARYRHAVYGELEQVGAFWDFGDLPLTLDRAPPALGQHSRQVWELLGLDGGQVAALEQLGLSSTMKPSDGHP